MGLRLLLLKDRHEVVSGTGFGDMTESPLLSDEKIDYLQYDM
jgi:hypothetical protein